MKQVNKGQERMFSRNYWKRVFWKSVMYVGIFALLVTVIGVLAIPLIMSLVYTWMWMFLYLVYLVVAFLIIGFSEVLR